MAETVVATHGTSGETTTSFHYCGFVAASGPGLFGEPTDFDVIEVWLNQYFPDPSDYAHVVVTARSDAGDPGDQFVWVAEPGGTHIEYYGVDDGGEGDLLIPTEFHDSGYYKIRIGSRADLSYCFDVLVNGTPIPDDNVDNDWHVGGPHG